MYILYIFIDRHFLDIEPTPEPTFSFLKEPNWNPKITKTTMVPTVGTLSVIFFRIKSDSKTSINIYEIETVQLINYRRKQPFQSTSSAAADVCGLRRGRLKHGVEEHVAGSAACFKFE